MTNAGTNGVRHWNGIKAFKTGVFCILLGQLFTIGTALAAQNNPIRVATRANLPPYIIQNATSGIEVDVVRAIFQEMGRSVEFVQMDRVAMIERFEQNDVEGALTQGATATSHGCLTDWYMVHQNVGFSLYDSKIELNVLDDLSELAVVTFQNAKTFLGEPFKSIADANPRYQEIAPQGRHIGMLYRGEVDVIVGDEWIIRYVQRHHFEKTAEYYGLQLHQIMPPTLYSARFQNQSTCDNFNRALAAIRTSGLYSDIVDGYHRRALVVKK